MCALIRPLLAGLQFFTRIPLKGPFSAEDLGRSVAFFPAIGLTLGALAALAWLGLESMGLSAQFRAFAAVAALAALNGGLHLDGLADSADGLLSSRPREQALEIMKDSRVGAMGALALMAVLGLKVAALAEVPDLAIRGLLLAPAAGKLAQLGAMAFCPYVRPQGLAALFVGNCRTAHFWGGLAAVAALWVLLTGSAGLAAAALAPLPGLYFCRRCRLRLGGMTGDTLGALCEITEAAALCAFALCKGLF